MPKMEIIIEKGSRPEMTARRDVLNKMEVGDSFLVDEKLANSIRNCVWIYFHRTTDKVFRSTVKGQPKGKIRFWRDK